MRAGKSYPLAACRDQPLINFSGSTRDGSRVALPLVPGLPSIWFADGDELRLRCMGALQATWFLRLRGEDGEVGGDDGIDWIEGAAQTPPVPRENFALLRINDLGRFDAFSRAEFQQLPASTRLYIERADAWQQAENGEWYTEAVLDFDKL